MKIFLKTYIDEKRHNLAVIVAKSWSANQKKDLDDANLPYIHFSYRHSMLLRKDLQYTLLVLSEVPVKDPMDWYREHFLTLS